MSRLNRFRPSPAMVIASIALLVALAGTSVAAVTALPRNSVGTAQLKSNAVVSSKVQNRSLKSVDFATGQLPRGPRGPQGPPGAAGPAGPTGPVGPAGVAAPGYVAQVVSQTSASSSSTNSQTFTDLSGSSQTIAVPTGETARLYVTFSAESACSGGTGFCGVRVTVDGNEISPVAGNDFAFDSTDNGTETSSSWESHSMTRVTDTLAAGNHTVVVQMRTTQAATTLRLDDWAVVVQRTRIS